MFFAFVEFLSREAAKEALISLQKKQTGIFRFFSIILYNSVTIVILLQLSVRWAKGEPPSMGMYEV